MNRAVILLAKHCEEKFGLVLQFPITPNTVGGYVGFFEANVTRRISFVATLIFGCEQCVAYQLILNR